MVITFLVFWSIYFTSSFIHSIMPALYRVVDTTHSLSLGIHALNLISISMLLSIKFSLKVFFPNIFFHLFLTYIPFLQNTKVLILFISNLTNLFIIFKLRSIHSTSFPLFVAKTLQLSIPNFIDYFYKAINLILVVPIELQVVHKKYVVQLPLTLSKWISLFHLS